MLMLGVELGDYIMIDDKIKIRVVDIRNADIAAQGTASKTITLDNNAVNQVFT